MSDDLRKDASGASRQRRRGTSEHDLVAEAEAETLSESERVRTGHASTEAAPTVAGDASVDGDMEIAAGGAVAGAEGGLYRDAWEELRRDKLFLVGCLILIVLVAMALFPGLFSRGVSPRACSLSRSLGRPSWPDAPFGYDVQGCDYLANVVYGVRPSLIIALVCTTATFIIGLLGGAIAGFYGGKVDAIMSRLTDIVFGIPYLLFGIIILTVLNIKSVWTVALVLIVTSWPTMLRLTRSSVISVKDADYVLAARALGASKLRLLRKHVLPNSLAPTLAYATLVAGTFIVGESTLSFLGIGLQLPDISWGLQLSAAQDRFVQARHLLIFPGLFLSVTVFAFSLIGNSVRDALDPKLR